MSKKRRKNKQVKITKKQEEEVQMENVQNEDVEVVQEETKDKEVVEENKQNEVKEKEVVQNDSEPKIEVSEEKNKKQEEEPGMFLKGASVQEYCEKIKEDKVEKLNLTQSEVKRFKDVIKLLEDYEVMYKEKYNVEISGEMTDGEIKELEDTLKAKIKEKIQEMKKEEAERNKPEEGEQEEVEEPEVKGEGIFKRFLKGLATIIAGLIAAIVFVIALPFTTIGALFKRNKKEAQSSKHNE